MSSSRSGHSIANRLLDQLLALPDGDLRNVLGVAREYTDNPSIAGAKALPAGKRLIQQIEFGLNEIGRE